MNAPENDWELIQDLYDKGLDLDETGRSQLLASQVAEVVDEVRDLWDNSDDDDEVFAFDELQAFAARNKAVLPPDDHADQMGLPHVGDRYQLIEKIDQGGMGTVFKAEQLKPIRRPLVALKLLAVGLRNERYFQRFQEEQNALGLLTHSNIAAVYDADMTPDGCPFFTMEYLDGIPITDYCDQHQLDIRQRLKLFLQICEGIHHAHQRGVIHCDIKPSNILVCDRDDRAVPKIIDFGISRLKQQQDDGTVMGTPAYMSPEQASAHSRERIDTRSDIYSLGVLLYELLVGVTPLSRELATGTGFDDYFQILSTSQPIHPSGMIGRGDEPWSELASKRTHSPASLKKKLRQDLDWITLKALAKDPDDRYDSCRALIEEINRHLAGYPVLAAPPGRFYPLARFIGRNKTAVGVAIVFLIVTFAGVIGTLYSLKQAIDSNKQLTAVQDFSLGIFRDVDPYREGRDVKAIVLLEKAAREGW